MINQHYITDNQQQVNFKKLFDGIFVEAKTLFSARLLLLFGISKRVLHGDIYRQLIGEILDFQDFEVDFVNYSTRYGQTVSEISERQIEKTLAENNKYNQCTDISKFNKHHIIARMRKSHGFQVGSSGLIQVETNPFWSNFIARNPTNMCKFESGKLLRGADNHPNIVYMTTSRHNGGLNTRFPGHLFPHLQGLAEYEFIGPGLYNIYSQEDPSFQKIKELLLLPFDELYQESSYEFVPIVSL